MNKILNFFFHYFNLIFEYEEYNKFLKTRQTISPIQKKQIVVYRIEHKLNGIGPYRNSDLDRNGEKDTPTPYYDNFKTEWIWLRFNRLNNHYKFGFKNQQQLLNWFSIEELNMLNKKGYKLFIYSTNNYFASDKQVCFNENDSNYIKNLNIKKIL